MLAVDIVITCYNREKIVTRAVHSALDIMALGISTGKVIIVDDASSDGSVALLKDTYAHAIAQGQIELVQLPANQGVTGAKNAGVAASNAQWVVILDSDDTLLSAHWPDACNALMTHAHAPIVMFRCIDIKGELVGTAFANPQSLSLSRFLTYTSYGEAIAAINKRILTGDIYDTDLRGSEGVGCARAIKHYGPAILSPVVLRQYDQTGNDRLSTHLLRRRAGSLARTHVRMLRLFFFDMPWRVRFKSILKVAFYSVFALIYPYKR